jgi:hypothetical protein
MFLCAVARPRYDKVRNQQFDGQLGIWPLVNQAPEERASRNRPAGTMVTKPIEVNREIYRHFLIENLLPAIGHFWPKDHKGTIYIQHDNTRPHIRADDDDFVRAVVATGRDIQLEYQPPNSPDLNVLDLGYFTSIQSLQQTKQSTTVDELIEVVEDSYRELDSRKLNNIFFSLQCCMKQIILHGESNN